MNELSAFFYELDNSIVTSREHSWVTNSVSLFNFVHKEWLKYLRNDVISPEILNEVIKYFGYIVMFDYPYIIALNI